MRKLCYNGKTEMEGTNDRIDTRHRSSVYDSMVKSPNHDAMLRATGMTDKDFETSIMGWFQLRRKIHHVTFTCMILGSG